MSIRRFMPSGTILLYIVTVLFCTTIISVAACGAHQREITLKATLGAVETARTTFVMWDGKHQLELVQGAATREQGEKELADYRARRALAVDAFVTTVLLIATAATLSDDLSMAKAVAAGQSLLRDLRALGVPLI